MRIMLLGLAAPMAAITFPAAAAALDPASPQFTIGAAAGVTVHRGGGPSFDRPFHSDFRRGHGGFRRDRRRGGDFGGFVYFDDREFQGDTVWRHDSYNDWWHERPNRSFPRWVRNNENCERQWWSGAGWRC